MVPGGTVWQVANTISVSLLGWTWVSPDIWVDNDDNGVADRVVWFDVDNKLDIRLAQQGQRRCGERPGGVLVSGRHRRVCRMPHGSR